MGRGTPRVLDDLSPSEGRSVLRILLHRHPELTEEAEEAARLIASDVDPDHIAEDIEYSARVLGFDELNARAGRQSWGYVHPTEAAWEMLSEVLEDHLAEMKRLARLGLEGAATDTCVGILLGLYRLREARGNPILEMAPDFCDERATDVLSQWTKAPGPLRGRRELPEGFVAEELPEWSSLIQ